jgi:RNA polymerase sigma-70 factor, ECF subfamily
MTEQPSRIRTLIDRAREGDDTAREELFQCCRNYVAVLARTHVESWMQAKVDASDLVQQTLLDAHCGFDRFQGRTEGEWLAWLKQILAHNVQDFIRRFRAGKRNVHREATTAAGEGDDPQALVDLISGSLLSPSQALMQHERELQLADALSRLSRDHQEVIHLRNLQRLPFDEVARRMDRSRPAVQMLWMRALKKLDELLSDSPL